MKTDLLIGIAKVSFIDKELLHYALKDFEGNVEIVKDKRELLSYPIDIPVIMLGINACKEFLDLEELEEKLTTLNGTSVWKDGRRFIYSNSPAYIFNNLNSCWMDFYFILTDAVKHPVKLSDKIPNYVLIDDYLGLNVLGENVYSLDIETTGLNAYEDEILCIAISVKENEQSFIITPKVWSSQIGKDLLIEFLSTNTFILHNAKFDAKFLFVRFGIKIHILHDTMLLHYVLDERVGTHGLKKLCQMKLGLPDYESNLKKHLKRKSDSYSTIPENILYEYASKDVVYTYRLAERLLLEIEPEYYKLYNFLLEACNTFIDIEAHGIYIDKELLTKLKNNLVSEKEIYISKLKSIVQNDNFNPNSFKQVQKVIYDDMRLPVVDVYRPTKPKTNRPTDRYAIEKLKELYPSNEFLDNLIQYREIAKILSTYILPIENRICSDGRLRTDFNLHGTVTGRLSSSKPNLQNIPRPTKNEYAEQIRNLFIAKDDNILVGADYSQAELKVAATLSKEYSMKQVWDSGKDLHTETTIDIFGNADNPEHRTIAKMLNFGLLYGRSAKSISVERGIAEFEAQELINKFFKAKPSLNKWLNEIQDEAVSKGEIKTINGRKRRFGYVHNGNIQQVQRQASNFPIQALASDITLKAAIDINKKLHDEKLGQVILLVHDSIYVETNKYNEYKVKEIMQHYMLSAPKEILQEDYVSFTIDIHSSKRWGEL